MPGSKDMSVETVEEGIETGVSKPILSSGLAVTDIPISAPTRTITVGINLVRFGDPHIGGNLVYAREMVSRIIASGTPTKLFCWDVDTCCELFGEEVRPLCVPVPGKRAMLAMHFGLKKACRQAGVDVLFSPSHLFPMLAPACPVVCTIHDLNFKHFSQGKKKDLYKSVMYKWMVAKATRLITISEFTRQDVYASFPKALGKTDMIHNGVTTFAEVTEEAPDQPYILAIGHHPHKRPEFAIEILGEVYQIRPQSNLRLKICGLPKARIEELQDVVADAGLEGKVDLFPYVPDSQLAELYQHAIALVFPSTFEGFGLPVLEAMSHGTPVIALNSTSLPEVMGDAGILLDDTEAIRWAVEVLHLQSDRERWQELWTRGKIQAALFSWDRCASRVLTTLRTAVESRSPQPR